MHLLIYGATIPDTFTPDDIADDHMPYGFLSARYDSGEWMMGIAVLRWGEDGEAEEVDLDDLDDFDDGIDVPVLTGDPHGLDESALGALAASSVPVQYAQARAAWDALRKLYGALPAAGLFTVALAQGLPMAPAARSDVEFH